MIKLQLIGHLGRNAVQREANGKSVLGFSVAHTERFRNQLGVQQERTIWVECSVWERENLGPYLLQGTQVFVEGTPSVDAYNSNTGDPAAALKLRVTSLRLLASRRDDVNQDSGRASADTENADESADDLPF